MDDPIARQGSALLPNVAPAPDGTSLVIWALPGSSVYGSRVARSGEVLDPLGFEIFPPRRLNPSHVPSLASNGSEWLVADYDVDSQTVFARRVSSDGTVLDTSNIALAVEALGTNAVGSLVGNPAVARNGDGFWVTWVNADGAVRGARVGADGSLVDPGGIVISPGGTALESALVSDGTNALVVWYDGSTGVRAARLAPDGTVLDPSGITLGGGPATTLDLPHEFRAAYNGVEWLVGWIDGSFSGQHGFIELRRVGRDGTPIGSAPVQLAGGANVTRLDLKGIATDGVDWGVLYTSVQTLGAGQSTQTLLLPNLLAADLTQAGVIPIAADDAGGPITYNGEHWVIPYVRAQSFKVDVTAVGTPQILPGYFNVQDGAVAAFNGTSFLVAWQDHRNAPNDAHGPADIYATRVTPDGVALDRSGIAVTHGESVRIASDGQNWLLAAEQGNAAIALRRVSALGQVLDANDIAISTVGGTASDPELGFDGENWLVVYAAFAPAGDPPHGLFAERVGSSGSLLASRRIELTDRETTGHAVTFDGSNWLVAWVSTTGDAFVTRLSPAGGVLDAAKLPIALGTTTAHVAIAYGSGGLFVAWVDGAGTQSPAVKALRLTSRGELVDAGSLLVAALSPASSYSNVALARYGTDWLVTWSDDAQATGPDVHGAVVASTGPATITPFVVSAGLANELSPTAANGAGNVLLAYTSQDFANTRIEARTIALPCADSHDPVCAWSPASGGFAGAFEPASDGDEAGAAGFGNASGTSPVEGQGGSPGAGQGGRNSTAGRGSGGGAQAGGGNELGGQAGEMPANGGVANGGVGGAAHAGGAAHGGSAARGGSAGAQGAPSSAPAGHSGCACRAAGGKPSTPWSVPFLSLVGALAVSRRRRAGVHAAIALLRRRAAPDGVA